MTRDPERIDEVLEELEEYWKEHPDLRLGQLISNIANRHGHKDSFYIEDRRVLATLKGFNNNND